MNNPLEIAPPGSPEDSPQLARFSRLAVFVGVVLVFLGILDIALEVRKINFHQTSSVLTNLIGINESSYLPLLGLTFALLPLVRHNPRREVYARAFLTWVSLSFSVLLALVIPSVMVSTIKARNEIGIKENSTQMKRTELFQKIEKELRETPSRDRLEEIIKPLISDPKFFAEPDTEVLRVNILNRLEKVRHESEVDVRDKISAATTDLFITSFQQAITATLLSISFFLVFFFGRPWREMART